MKRFIAIVAPLVLAIGLAACSTASADQPAPAATPAAAAGTVKIVAKDAAFQAPAGSASAGSAFDIDFVNQDGFPHNVELYDASGTKVFGGDLVTGGEVTYHVQALTAGTYHVKCVVHPDMDQTLTVK